MKISRYLVFFIAFTCSVINLKSQSIRVLFNQPVDNNISQITDAVEAINIEDTICHYIDLAVSTIDIAVWDNGSSKIVTSLNNAHNRGVVVRYISSSNSLNTALSGLNPAISVLERQASISTNVMHNKFILFDHAFMLTGSMNFGNGSMFDDYNNVIFIFDNSLTQAFTMEFNEMWGGSGAIPNSTNSKFGPDKSDNTIHDFNINGNDVELYFSPTDGTTAQIVNAIYSANHTLDIAMFTFINNDIGDAVLAAKARGVVVRAIIENVSYVGSEYSSLLSHGVNVFSHASLPNDFHHKYCIIDAEFPDSDPIVVTGSHNWTNSAEEDNDENTLIIHNYIIANQYLEEFSKRFSEVSPTDVEKEMLKKITIFPNPTNGNCYIQTSFLMSNATIFIKSMNGKTVQTIWDTHGFSCELNNLNYPKGIYIIEIENDSTVIRSKIVIK